jgi:hypothetical protein
VSDEPLARPVFGYSGLSEAERALLVRLAIWNLERQTGCTPEQAAQVLDHLAAGGNVTIEGERRDVYLKVCGHTHIHAERSWLRWAATIGTPSAN